MAIGEGLEHLREFARPMTALYVGGMGARGRNFYNALTRRYGFEAEADLIQDLYLSGKKDEAAAAVPAELLELTSLVGPAGYVQERIAAYREAGVSVLNVTPIGPDPLATVRTVEGVVLVTEPPHRPGHTAVGHGGRHHHPARTRSRARARARRSAGRRALPVHGPHHPDLDGRRTGLSPSHRAGRDRPGRGSRGGRCSRTATATRSAISWSG